jgi:hypothetical protein
MDQRGQRASRYPRHEALYYRSPKEYLAGTAPFVRAGLRNGEPVFVAVPARYSLGER